MPGWAYTLPQCPHAHGPAALQWALLVFCCMHTEHNHERQQWKSLLGQVNACTDSDTIRAWRGHILGIQQKGRREIVLFSVCIEESLNTDNRNTMSVHASTSPVVPLHISRSSSIQPPMSSRRSVYLLKRNVSSHQELLMNWQAGESERKEIKGQREKVGRFQWGVSGDWGRMW